MISVHELQSLLDEALGAQLLREGDDPNGVWRPGKPFIRSVGLLIEAGGDALQWITDRQLDALIVHRPWRLPEDLPGGLNVLAYHQAFDERLTIGMNPYLAEDLGMWDVEALGEKEGRPIGMLGNIEDSTFTTFAARIESMFGTAEAWPNRSGMVRRVAAVGAMRPDLIDEATRRGADVYLTGDVRRGALPAVHQTGVGLVAVGGLAAERWGLRRLARMVQGRFPDVRVVLYER